MPFLLWLLIPDSTYSPADSSRKYSMLDCSRFRERWHLLSEPTVFENYVHDIHLEDQIIELSLWDTAGEGFSKGPCSQVEMRNVV